MKWNVTAASARGSAHQRSGLPNQDACQFRTGERSSALRAVLAVSDGHGGARHFRSQVGSSLAVNAALNAIHDSLTAMLDEDAHAIPSKEFVPELIERICQEWRAAVLADLQHNPLEDRELTAVAATEGQPAMASVLQDPFLAYGATLLAAAVSGDFVLFLQLGDGDILVVGAAGETARPVPVDARLIANQTTSLCQESAAKEFRFALSGEIPALILVSTDGYANSFRSESFPPGSVSL